MSKFVDKISKYTFVVNQQERDEVVDLLDDLRLLIKDLNRWADMLQVDGINSKKQVMEEIKGAVAHFE